MSEDAALLFANEAFYVAFATRDIVAMEAAWADLPGLTCIHPGWAALIGRDRVMASWRSILVNPEAPNITFHDAAAHRAGDAGYVTCIELADTVPLAATNLFVRRNGVWRMLHHHAGPAPAPRARTAGALPPPSVQ